MYNRLLGLIAGLALVVSAGRAEAQVFETVGVRAQGMSAFVAVADDATAAWWNPAGLATGKFFSLVLDHGRTDDPGVPAAFGPARRDTSDGFSVAFPAMAFSYYRIKVSQYAPGSDPGAVTLQTRALTQYGVTVGQSLGNHVVVGTTLKALSSGQAWATGVGPVGDSNALLDQIEDIDVVSETRSDLDIGVMAALGMLRLGATMKHVTTPEFGKGTVNRFVIDRQARAGFALVQRTGGLIKELKLAADFDITRTPTVNGDVRHIATGAEVGLAKRISVRTGVSINTVGEHNPTGSAGISLGGPFGLSFDSSLLYGADSARNGLNFGINMTF